MLKLILDFIFPIKCLNCHKTGNYICQDCQKNIEQSNLVCPFCERLSLGGITHPVCQRKYGLDGLWYLGTYKSTLKKAIQKLKYKWITKLASILVDLTIEYWAYHPPYFLDQVKKDHAKNWLIVPVPLHWKRKNWRGFNQAALLGSLISQKTGIEFAQYLKRIKNTKPQVGLEAYQRRQNIKNAFSLSTNHELSTKNILLIDDVWTTGSTLKECCYILKRGGAKKVWAITLAR